MRKTTRCKKCGGTSPFMVEETDYENYMRYLVYVKHCLMCGTYTEMARIEIGRSVLLRKSGESASGIAGTKKMKLNVHRRHIVKYRRHIIFLKENLDPDYEYTVDDVASMLHVYYDYVYRWISAGLKTRKEKRSHLIKGSSFIDFLEEQVAYKTKIVEKEEERILYDSL